MYKQSYRVEFTSIQYGKRVCKVNASRCPFKTGRTEGILTCADKNNIHELIARKISAGNLDIAAFISLGIFILYLLSFVTSSWNGYHVG